MPVGGLFFALLAVLAFQRRHVSLTCESGIDFYVYQSTDLVVWLADFGKSDQTARRLLIPNII